MLSDVAAPVDTANLRAELVPLSFTLALDPISCKDYLRLGTEEVLFLSAALLRCHYLAGWPALLHAVLELDELLKEDLEFEVLIDEECGLLFLDEEKDRLEVVNDRSLKRPRGLQVDHHKEVKHVVLYVLSNRVEREVLEEVD